MTRFRFDPARSVVSIDGRSSVHPIRASFDGVVGWIDVDDSGAATGGHLSVAVDRVSTGNPLYDREIRNRLAVKQYPMFEADLGQASVDEDGVTNSVSGSVEAHGATVVLTGTVQVTPDGAGGVRVTGSEQLDFRQFDLKAPRLLTLKVDPLVTVTLDAATFPADTAT